MTGPPGTPPLTVGVAVGDPAVRTRAVALLRESGFDVVQSFPTSAGVVAGVRDRAPDVLLLHDALGPTPALITVRDAVAEVPGLAVVLLSRSPTVDLVLGAADAGVRGVVGLPLSPAELVTRLVTAGTWSRDLRRDRAPRPVDGTVVAVAGAKGGVGTTTLALHLALAASVPGERRAVLVDLDLQRGDLTSLLGTEPLRGIGDLTGSADELSHAVVDRVLFAHASGLRVLLSPPRAEDAGAVGASLTRRVVGLLRAAFPVVVVDCGAVATDASAAVVELAQRVVLVTTPDGPGLRSGAALVAMWERLGVRDPDGVEVLLNRASRQRAVQLPAVRRHLSSPVCDVTVPDDVAAMESEVNEGSVTSGERHPVARAVRAAADGWGLLPPPAPRRRGRLRPGAIEGLEAGHLSPRTGTLRSAAVRAPFLG